MPRPIKVKTPDTVSDVREFTYLTDKIERYAIIKNSLSPKPSNSYKTNNIYLEDVVIVQFMVAPRTLNKKGVKAGRPLATEVEGRVVLTTDELLMSQGEFAQHCVKQMVERQRHEVEEKKKAYETYLALKAEFEK
jgi:hypothetical protein